MDTLAELAAKLTGPTLADRIREWQIEGTFERPDPATVPHRSAAGSAWDASLALPSGATLEFRLWCGPLDRGRPFTWDAMQYLVWILQVADLSDEEAARRWSTRPEPAASLMEHIRHMASNVRGWIGDERADTLANDTIIKGALP